MMMMMMCFPIEGIVEGQTRRYDDQVINESQFMSKYITMAHINDLVM